MQLSSLVVNCSILFGDRPIPEALERVRAAGGRAVEFWWPFRGPDPADAEVTAFLDALGASGLELAGLNLFAGDLPGGERGVLSSPGREAELRASVDVARVVQEATGCGVFNALYGRRVDGVPAAAQDALALDNLAHAAAVLGERGGTVVLEAVSGVPDYPLRTASDVAAVLDAARGRGVGHLGMLLDVYHLSVNGDDVSAAIGAHAPVIAHVQLADAPGRGLPGTGELPLRRWVDELRAAGYRGRVALEFQSSADDPFATPGRTHA